MPESAQTLLDAAESVCDAAHPAGPHYLVPDYLIAALQTAVDHHRAPLREPHPLIPSVPYSLSASPCASAR